MNNFILPILVSTLFSGSAVASCIVVGDSIALGVSQRLSRCVVLAKVGSTTRQIMQTIPETPFHVAIISAGSNDGERASLADLRALRREVNAQQIVWIVPSSKFNASSFVQYVAQEFGDRTISVDSVLSHDKTHPTPTGYRLLSAALAKFYHL